MVENYPVKTPMLDIVTVGAGGGSIVWTDSYGQLKVGPQSAGADPGPDLLQQGRHQADRYRCGRHPRTPAGRSFGGEIELDARAARRAFVVLGEEVGLDPDELAAGALEVAAANQVFGIRQVTTVRGREPGDYAMVAFGGAGGLFATEVADFLGINTVISPPDPGNLCAFGLHVCDVTRDYIRTLVRRQSSADADEIIAAWRELERLGIADIEGEGIPEGMRSPCTSSATSAISAKATRSRSKFRRELSGRRRAGIHVEEFHRVHDRTFGFHYEGQQDVELVNLRVRAVGLQHRPTAQDGRGEPSAAAPSAGARSIGGRRRIDVPLFRRAGARLRPEIDGPAIIEEYGSTAVIAPRVASVPEPTAPQLILERTLREANAMASPTPRRLGPIELEVIHGTIRAAELEIEAAVERTSRSPMIRDQHDYRVALFDAKGRKLTGRSYSAIVEPVFEYFGADDIHPGDVFFWNDPYNSCGGIGHVPDLCTTVPIFYGDRLIGFSQVFGHHDDVGGLVPGSLPVHATDSWMEGLLVPPIKLYERGKRNEAAFRIIVRNSRLSEHLKGDLDAEQGAARLGCRRIEALAQRYGVETLEQAFDQILDNTAAIFRREILPKIKDGVYHFEDYIEADGVDVPRLHTLRLTMTKTQRQDPAGFHRHRSGGQGPDQLGAGRG